jgi:hypothetical protein
MGGNSQVADAHKRCTAAQSQPVDGGDEDRGMVADRDQHFDPIRPGIRRCPCLGIRTRFLQINPRTKTVTATGQYDRSAFDAKRCQRGKKLATRVAVQSILLVRTVETQDGIARTMFDRYQGYHSALLS